MGDMMTHDYADLFAYDSNAPFNIQTVNIEQRDTITISDITFQAGEKSVSAYLVTPPGEGKFAGILWLHWLGEEKSNRTQYLDEAVALAKDGAVSLLIDCMWSQPHWYEHRVPDEDYANSIQQVIEIRRAMDLLLAQPNVDGERIGFVGHDYGGMYGTLATGLDPKAKASVFIAVTPSFYDWAFFANQPQNRVDYIRQNAVLEPMIYLPHIKNGEFLFQFAENDIYIGTMKRAEFYHNAPEPKTLLKYPTADHSMNLSEVAKDRDDWLRTTLGLTVVENVE
jgi:dienelactone hydrolase